MSVINVSESSFEAEVLHSNVPVLVDFWATWCGPCRVMNPIVERIANDSRGRIKVVKVDIDDNSDLAERYGVRAVPTFIIFQGGVAGKTCFGANPSRLEELVRSIR